MNITKEEFIIRLKLVVMADERSCVEDITYWKQDEKEVVTIRYIGGAKQAEEIERKKQELRTQLDQLTGPDCEELNFIPLPEELRDILNQIGEAVVDGKIRQITMKTYGTQIVIRGGEKIKATRSYKYEQGGEVQ